MPRVLFLLVLAVGFAALASAGSVTYDSVSDPAVVGVPLQLPDITGVIQFPQWDPALFPGQHLDSVVYTLYGHIEGSITLTNTGASDGLFSASMNSMMTLADLHGHNLVVVMPAISTGAQYGIALAPGQSVTFPASGVATGDQSASTVPLLLYLSDYTGTGFFSLPATSATGFSWANLGSLGSGSDEARVSMDGQVQYNFSSNETPEPAGMLLMGSGVAALWFRLRKRA